MYSSVVTSSAHVHDDRVYIRNFVVDLASDCALSLDDVNIVERSHLIILRGSSVSASQMNIALFVTNK